MTSIPESIFKAYDIRGLAPEEVSEEVAYRVGQSIVRLTGASTVVVGHDMRATSPALARAVMDGITSLGADVVFIGSRPTTAMLYFAVGNYPEHGAGIMVTASHNPAEYNGIKMCRGDVQPIGGETGMADIKAMVMAGRVPEAAHKGTVREMDVLHPYLDKVYAKFDAHSCRDLTIVVDTGNGMQGAVAKDSFDRQPKCSFHGMFLELDGSFPNHEANPLIEETLDHLKARMKEIGADLGVAFDGDGDRIGFVDEKGCAIRGDIIGALVAPRVLRDHPGSAVVYDVRCSMAAVEEIEKAGGTPVMSRVGHGLIKPLMKQLDACLGFELSMHYYFKDFYYADATDYCMLQVFELLTETGKPLSSLIEPLLRYHHSGEINSTVTDKQGMIAALQKKYGDMSGARVTTIDGVRVDFGTGERAGDWWWFNVRASNTEPLLRLNVESNDKALMETKRDELLAMIRG